MLLSAIAEPSHSVLKIELKSCDRLQPNRVRREQFNSFSVDEDLPVEDDDDFQCIFSANCLYIVCTNLIYF